MSDFTPPPPASPPPELRALTTHQVWAALRAGWADFRAEPFYGLLFGGVYAAGGIALFALLKAYGAPWMIIPLAIGFPLLGPFVAAGLYEISRRRTRGESIDSSVFTFMLSQSRREFGWMAFVILFIFWIWMYQVRILLAIFLGGSAGLGGLAATVFTSADGIAFLAVGSLIGAALAIALFSVTVIGMPLLVDREHDIVTAIVTSVRAVLLSPGPMLLWGAMISALTLLAILPLFLGLLIVLPVLGHASWHVYTAATKTTA